VFQEDITIDLPEDRDQLETRSLPRFTELRHHVYEQIQLAKQGHRPAAAKGSAAPTQASASRTDVA
jgi:NitT/TauT family transport system ATP-binding protein